MISKKNHSRINKALTLLVAVFALYILLTPLYPALQWRFTKHQPTAPYVGDLAKSVSVTASKPIPKENRIVIPSASIDLPIIEGTGIWVIDGGGAWRKNLWVKSPKDDGNTVIVGHRFTYRAPSKGFYNLDKVSIGDKLALYWQGEELLYEVVERKVVEPTDVYIENNTSVRTLTLYTCTPVITAEHRLVIVAKPLEGITN